MAELVRPKKPKHRERPQSDHTPVIPDRPILVNGIMLPAVPSHSIQQEKERSPSPEPEEQILSDTEVPERIDTESVKDEQNCAVRPAPPPPRGSQEREAPPIPARTMVFPKSTSMILERTQNPLITQRRSEDLASYPAIPELGDLPSYTSALKHPHVYPSVNAILQHSQSSTAIPEKTRIFAPVEEDCVREGEAPPMYPSINAYERNELGLMTEENLVTFYHNSLYESADIFVDEFIKTEEVPIQSGTLFPLLARLKSVCDLMTVSEVKGKENSEELQKGLRECWVKQTLSFEVKGKCGDNNDGSGRTTYISYELQQAVLDQMKKRLMTNRSNLMDHILCEETTFRSLALQIQWQVIIINNNFMAENGLTTNSPPCLTAASHMKPGRTALRIALSDIFYHLRYPRLSKRFVDTLVGWIKELTCVLNMLQSCEDGIFVLCHLLRLPSPIDQWAAPLVQTFIQSQSPPRLKLDYCVALLTHLLNPIKARESFLRHLAQSEIEDSTWEILADNDDEANEFSFVTINEVDLAAFLEQIPISEMYSVAYLAFTSYADKGAQFTAMVAFQLLLMKILDNGLTCYAQPGYKMFCKQIGIRLKHSVRELCSNWRLIRDQIRTGEECHLLKEVDRIVILSLNYLIHRDSVGLFQFVVALPYGVVSEDCKSRCEYTLRSERKMTIHEIYETPIAEVRSRNTCQPISKRIGKLGAQDSEFLINSLASIGSYSSCDISYLIKELIDICFCDETTRDDLYKCGGEAIGQILTKRPETFPQLLNIIDRNIQHMDTYAINVLSASRLFECRLTEPMISIIGKWLINNPPDHGANRLARRVLSSLYWGPKPDGQNLWIDVDVHAIAADTVVKAHSVHCSRSNSMISKSISKISKLASKVGDAESLFQQFCWDLLVKLKLPTVPVALVHNDLTAHYVRIVQNYEEDVEIYLEKGVPLLSDLVSSGSSVASVVLLSRLMAQHYQHVNLMTADKNFMSIFERLLHVDQLPYAVQWLSGPSSTPTPIVRLICSAISYYSAKFPPREYLRAWISLLCLSRTGWNKDAVTYQIMGTIARIAFVNDTHKLYEITSILFQAYQQQIAAEKNQSKGFLSMFSSDNTVSPLIPDSMLSISPFASYVMLRVEQKSFNTFYGHFFEALAKKEKYNLDQAVKKAASKCSIALPVDRLAIFRWAKLVSLFSNHHLLPILLQQLSGSAYQLRETSNFKLCYARRLIDEPLMKDTMDECRKSIECSTVETKGLAKAVAGWLFTKHEVTRIGFDFSVFDLDYLLQLILTGDKNMWLDFVDMPYFTSEELAEQKLFSVTCHLSPKQRGSPPLPEFSSPSSRSSAKSFPVLPVHSGLPQAPVIMPSMLLRKHEVLQLVMPFIDSIKNLSKQYTQYGDRMISDDEDYCKLIQVLYQSTSQTVPIEIRCSNCSNPKASTRIVKSNVLSSETDILMTQNRNKRIEFWNELNASLIDEAAVSTASVEHISQQISQMASTLQPASRSNAQFTGRSLFYCITSSVGENELLFSVASDCYNQALRFIGNEFVKFHAEEQVDVMQLALDGFVLSDPLVEVFTPEVLNSDDLCAAYKKLSDAVRMPEKSKMALQLLGRLGMQQATARLPPHQFSALLPIAFANLASQPDPSSPLHSLCLQHFIFFVFHHFPNNIVNGLDLALEGCNTNSTPSSLLDAIVDKLEARQYLKVKNSFDLGAAKADECARVLSKRLDEARTKLPNFYGIWSRYLDAVTHLAQLFLFVPIRDGYEPNKSISVLQRECYEYFTRVAAIFSPMIAPYSPTHPPFSPSHESQAILVLDRFVEFLSALHFNSSIPPGMQNIQSLVWQYYCEKLSILTHGTAHYYDVIERQLVRLNWQALWPSRLAITAMETCLDNRSPDCISFVSQIVARIPWNSILQSMPEESRPGYLASLFKVLVLLAARPRNYEKVRASLLELTKSLSLRSDWGQICSQDAIEIAKSVSKCLPSDSLSNPVEMVSVIQVIWRKICCFVVREPFSESALLKQTIWIQTECELLLKTKSSQMATGYNSLISDVNALALNHSNLLEFSAVSRELTAVWKNITDAKLGESLVSVWMEYLTTNPNSPLVLTSVNTVIGSLNGDQLTTALKVFEKLVAAYFLRTDSTWAELLHWVHFPNGSLKSIKSYLMTVPSSENKVQMLPLTLKIFMDYGASDDAKFFDLHNYVTSIRPKHVTSEAGFLCLLARLIQWLSLRSPSLPAQLIEKDDLFPHIIRYLGKVSKDESSFLTSLISSKKTSYSQKMRVILQVLELYLIQQSLGEGKRPRCDANSPVLNSRISAVKEIAQHKSNQNMINAFNKATVYFVQIETHRIQSSYRLLLEIGRCAFGDNFLSDV